VDFQLTKSGDLVLALEPGFEDGRRITISADGTLARYDHRERLSYQEELDGKSTYLFYDADGMTADRRGEVGGIRARREGTATLEVVLDQGRLRTLERSVTGRDGKTTKTVVARPDGGGWIDEERNRYSAAWITQTPRRVFLSADHGKLMRVIHEDGSETRVRYDDRYETRYRVARNAWGEVTAVVHADRSITHFERDEAGEVVLLQQGPDILVADKKEARGTFSPSISPGSRFSASLRVNSQGTQIWTGRNGIERFVYADGTVQLSRSDGSKAFHAPDGAVRYVFASRVGSSISEVTNFQNGDVEWTFFGGAVGRHAAHGFIDESLKKDRTPELDDRGRPRRSLGFAAVGPKGDLSFLGLDRRVLLVRHADGTVTDFESSGTAAWKDPGTGEAFAATLAEVQQRLAAIGAATPGLASRHMAFAETESANRYRLSLGMFEFESLTARPGRASPRRPVSFITRKKWERPIASVMLKPDGNPEIGYAATPRPQPRQPGASAPAQRSPSTPPGTDIPPEMLEMARSGNLNAQFNLGLRYLKTGDKEKAREWLTKAANAGHLPAKLAVKDLAN
jgi:hypothetical protein